MSSSQKTKHRGDLEKYCRLRVDETDAKKILTASPLENWRRPPGRLRTTWMKTIQQDLKSNNLSMNEAIDVAQNCTLWRMMSTSGTTQS